jgi:hypothetical protein
MPPALEHVLFVACSEFRVPARNPFGKADTMMNVIVLFAVGCMQGTPRHAVLQHIVFLAAAPCRAVVPWRHGTTMAAPWHGALHAIFSKRGMQVRCVAQ